MRLRIKERDLQIQYMESTTNTHPQGSIAEQPTGITSAATLNCRATMQYDGNGQLIGEQEMP